METIQVTFDSNNLELDGSKTSTATIENSGDLISKMVLVIKIVYPLFYKKYNVIHRNILNV